MDTIPNEILFKIITYLLPPSMLNFMIAYNRANYLMEDDVSQKQYCKIMSDRKVSCGCKVRRRKDYSICGKCDYRYCEQCQIECDRCGENCPMCTEEKIRNKELYYCYKCKEFIEDHDSCFRIHSSYIENNYAKLVRIVCSECPTAMKYIGGYVREYFENTIEVNLRAVVDTLCDEDRYNLIEYLTYKLEN